MSNSNELHSRLAKHITAKTFVPERDMTALAQIVMEAVAASSKIDLDHINESLVELTKSLSGSMTLEQRHELATSNGSLNSSGTAYLLGSLEFAQILASRASNKLIDHRFVEICNLPINLNYLRHLENGHKTNVELAGLTATAVETVSRKMSELTNAGITDFRSSGRTRLNFLTPAAHDILREHFNESQHLERALDAKIGIEALLTKMVTNIEIRKPASFDVAQLRTSDV